MHGLVPDHVPSVWKAAVVKCTSQGICEAMKVYSLGVLNRNSGAEGCRGIASAWGSYWMSHPMIIIALDKGKELVAVDVHSLCLLYTSPSPRDLSTSRMPSSA